MRYRFTPSDDITVKEIAHIMQIAFLEFGEDMFRNLSEEAGRHFTPVEEKVAAGAPQYYVYGSGTPEEIVGTCVLSSMEESTPDPHNNS